MNELDGSTVADKTCLPEIMLKLQNNDPDLTSLTIGVVPIGAIPVTRDDSNSSGFLPRDDQLCMLGELLGRNDHVTELCIGNLNSGTPGKHIQQWRLKKWDQFCTGLAANRSITKLEFIYAPFSTWELHTGEGYSMMAPFLRRNNVEEIYMTNRAHSFDELSCELNKETKLFANALAGFNSLISFRYDFTLEGDVAQRIFRGLSCHSNLSHLCLSGNVYLDRKGQSAFAFLLQSCLKLEILFLEDRFFGNNCASAVYEALEKKRSLKKLKILSLDGCHGINITGWKAVAAIIQRSQLEQLSCLGTYMCTDSSRYVGEALAQKAGEATSLSLSCINGIGRALLQLMNSLRNATQLVSLDVSSNNVRSVQSLSQLLRNRECMLENLNLANSPLNGECLSSLAGSLLANGKLRTLNLSKNSGSVYTRHWLPLVDVLGSSKSGLVEVNLHGNYIGNDVATRFAEALVENIKLQKLGISDCGVTQVGYDAFSRLLCDKAGIMSTHRSNHTLEALAQCACSSEPLPGDLARYLGINNQYNKPEAARIKIEMFHFHRGFSITPFVGMDTTVLACALAWMSKSTGGPSLMFELVRSTPGLFESR